MKLFLKYAENILPTWPTAILDEIKIVYDKNITLGEILISTVITQELFEKLQKKISEQGFTILYDRKEIIIQKIKYVVYSMLETDQLPSINTSMYISNHMHLNYTYLANIFSKAEGMTIERFIILQKIEKAKRLLLFHEYEIKQVALTLHYSSVGHFSNQFKKITGLSPTEYKQQPQ